MKKGTHRAPFFHCVLRLPAQFSDGRFGVLQLRPQAVQPLLRDAQEVHLQQVVALTVLRDATAKSAIVVSSVSPLRQLHDHRPPA